MYGKDRKIYRGVAKTTGPDFAKTCLVTRPLGRNLFRSEVYERGLEHYAWHLYEDRNFLDALHRKLIATLS